MGRPKVQRVSVTCEACGKVVQRRLTDLARNKSGRVFCSAVCRNRIGPKPRSVPERICERCGVTFRPLQRKAVARFCSKPCYDESQRKDSVLLACTHCGREIARKPSQVVADKPYCSRECLALGRIKRPLDRMHNGRPARLNRFGYVLVHEPSHPAADKGGWIAEHRLVAEQMIGRPLASTDEVHHDNRVRDDNRPENLVVLDGVTHSVVTQSQRRSDRELLAEYLARYGPIEDRL